MVLGSGNGKSGAFVPLFFMPRGNLGINPCEFWSQTPNFMGMPLGHFPNMASIKRRNRLKILLWTALTLILGTVLAQLVFAQKVRTALEPEKLGDIDLAYGKLTTNVLLGRITLHDLALQGGQGTADLKAKRARISGLHYLPLLQRGDIILTKATLDEPVLVYRMPKKDTLMTKDKTGPGKKFRIESLQVNGGYLKILRQGRDSLWAKLEGIDLEINQLSFDGESTQGSPSFSHGHYHLESGKGYHALGPWEILQWQGLRIQPDSGHIRQLVLRTKLGKRELSQSLAVERDHFDLSVDSLSIGAVAFDPASSPVRLQLQKLLLHRPVFQVYRDKLLPDDTTHKKLYGQVLRDLGMDLQVDTLAIAGGWIGYKERLEAEVKPESLVFNDISAEIHNLHSRGRGPVEVAISAQLMGDGPLSLDWSFDPADKSNAFVVRASLRDFDTRNISPFLRSNLNAEVSGRIDRLYFTISGHELESQGDMKMAYGDFDFVVLKKDRLGVNKLLTALVNLFAKDGRKDDTDGFRHGHFNVQRQRDRSFFNYLWLNLREGLVATMTGSGKKKDK